MKSFFGTLAAVATMSSSLLASEDTIGVVNFATCITDSKIGQNEQQAMDSLRMQMSNMMEETDKKLKDLASKFEDTDYLDSLSPKAEEEMRMNYQALQEDMQRYQQQFYQILQHNNYQMLQKMSLQIGAAAETVAKEKGLHYVMNKEACFYINPDLDITSLVIGEMDKTFEINNLAASDAEASHE